MLINTTLEFKENDIVTIKNNLGEELITKFISENSTHYTINKPVALGMGEQGMQFMPPIMSGITDNNVEFPKAMVMWIVPTKEEFESQYVQQMTGLAVPPKNKSIIT